MTGDTLRFGTTRLATSLRLHHAEAGQAGGEAILFLHGWPDSWFSWSRILPLLPERLHALAPDHRGFGDSERPAGGYGIHDLASDAVAFLDAMKVERATVVGHSLGSFVARCVALNHPERVDRLVLIGTGYSPVNPVTREVQVSIRDLADPLPEGFARDFQAGTAHRPLPATFFDRIVAESLKAPARVWRDVFDRLLTYDDGDRLDRIAARTLILWGEKDAIFPRGDQDRLRESIPGARLEIYPETGHCPNWEWPERVADDLAGFLRE